MITFINSIVREGKVMEMFDHALLISGFVTISIFTCSFIMISKKYGYRYMIEKQEKPHESIK